MSEISQGPSLKPQTVVIQDKRELYRCYLPFIKGGGLYLPFNEDVNVNMVSPGQKVFIVFSMLESKQKVPIHGKVVWICKGKGYGVAFGDSPLMKTLKENIENNILDLAAKKEVTYTI